MKKCVIICNTKSGKGIKQAVLDRLLEVNQTSGYEVTFYKTEYAGHAYDIIKEIEVVDWVISMGGDGTFNEVVTGMLEREDQMPLSHLPVGTTNDIGTMYGLGKDPIRNFKLLLDGSCKEVDICTINNHPFVYVAGFGKFMNIPYETPRKLKKKIGYLAYLFHGLRALFTKINLMEMTYTVDEKEYAGLFSLIIITNANRVAGVKNIYNDIKLDDHEVEILFTNITKKKDLIKTLYYLRNHAIERISGVYFYKTKEVDITLKEPSKNKWCIDGEKLEETSTNYHIAVDRKIKMIVPKKVIPKLFQS